MNPSAIWRRTQPLEALTFRCLHQYLGGSIRLYINIGTLDPNHCLICRCMRIDSFAKHVTDAVGAGDALLAYATLSLRATNSPVIASILGSMAAAVACEQEGNVPISTARVAEMLNTAEKQANYV